MASPGKSSGGRTRRAARREARKAVSLWKQKRDVKKATAAMKELSHMVKTLLKTQSEQVRGTEGEQTSTSVEGGETLGDRESTSVKGEETLGERKSTSVEGGETLGGSNDHEGRVRQQEGSGEAYVPAPESKETRQDNEAQVGNVAQEKTWRESAALAREKMSESGGQFFTPCTPRLGDAEEGSGTGGTLSSPHPDPLPTTTGGEGGRVEDEVPAGPGDHVLGGRECTGRGHLLMMESTLGSGKEGGVTRW